MKVKKEVARDISYASSAKSKAGRAVIRSIENMTGRIRLIKKAKNYENEVALGRNFWEAATVASVDIRLPWTSRVRGHSENFARSDHPIEK